MIPLRRGTKLDVSDHELAEGNHLKLYLIDGEKPTGAEQWEHAYLYLPHCDKLEVVGNTLGNQPKSETDRPNSEHNDTIVIAGQRLRLGNPILTNGNFTWAEATHGGTRIPPAADADYVMGGMIAIARQLEHVRSMLGNRPIHINSWYRDPETNWRVGGASRSRHLSGDAVDFVVTGISPQRVYTEIDLFVGASGGLASSSVFTHLDYRGYYARWSYGF